MPKSVIVIYGPPGCGKTNAAEALRDYYYCDEIVDSWIPGDNQEIPDNALILTNVKPSDEELASLHAYVIVESFDDAVEKLL